jgi:hypothetical protein
VFALCLSVSARLHELLRPDGSLACRSSSFPDDHGNPLFLAVLFMLLLLLGLYVLLFYLINRMGFQPLQFYRGQFAKRSCISRQGDEEARSVKKEKSCVASKVAIVSTYVAVFSMLSNWILAGQTRHLINLRTFVVNDLLL